MILVLKPVGSGNWNTLVMRIRGTRSKSQLLVVVGDKLTLAGIEYRICEVRQTR